VPELARFYGIIVRMYMEQRVRHRRPHFHVYYGEMSAVYSIDVIELISGSLPKRQQRFVEAWAELHQAELLANWERLQTGRLPLPIEPLK
jgi:hypothetical protein